MTRKHKKEQLYEGLFSSFFLLFETENFLVEEIVAQRVNAHGKREFQIKWLGYPSDQNTWEPEENLENCRRLLEEFLRNSSSGTTAASRMHAAAPTPTSTLPACAPAFSPSSSSKRLRLDFQPDDVLAITCPRPTQCGDALETCVSPHLLYEYIDADLCCAGVLLLAHQRSRDPQRPSEWVPTSTLATLCPIPLIAFYESKLQFSSSRASTHPHPPSSSQSNQHQEPSNPPTLPLTQAPASPTAAPPPSSSDGASVSPSVARQPEQQSESAAPASPSGPTAAPAGASSSPPAAAPPTAANSTTKDAAPAPVPSPPA